MDKETLENLLRLVKLIGGKFIIVEGGKPRAVLMSYEEFQDLVIPGIAKNLAEKLADVEKINEAVTRAQLLDLREEVIVESPEEIRIEPLT
jgi:hypothetical protein